MLRWKKNCFQDIKQMKNSPRLSVVLLKMFWYIICSSYHQKYKANKYYFNHLKAIFNFNLFCRFCAQISNNPNTLLISIFFFSFDSEQMFPWGHMILNYFLRNKENECFLRTLLKIPWFSSLCERKISINWHFWYLEINRKLLESRFLFI
jgi:hypothetical protein